MWFCLGVIVGVFFAQKFQIDNLFVLIIALIVLFFCFWRRWLVLLPVIFIIGTAIGITRGSTATIELQSYSPYMKKNISVSGRVCEDIDAGSSGEKNAKICDISVNGKALSGKIWVSVSTDERLRRGDRIVVHGKLLDGFGNYAGVMYRAKLESVVFLSSNDWALRIRDWFAGLVRQAIPEPQASLGVGYLVGQKSALPADLVEVLKLAGLTHIVVASGYNLTILVRLARRIFTKVSKYQAALFSVLMISGFIAVTGASPSMVRAGLVSILSLFAWYYGRKFHPIVLLVFVAMLTLLINPSYVWGDVGWQLSFAAFAGVMILAPFVSRYFFGEQKLGFVAQILVETVSAQIATAPILISVFSQISNVAIMSNLLILPLVPLAMLLTFLAGVGAYVAPGIAEVFGVPAFWLLSYMTNVAKYFADLSWAVSELNFGVIGVFASYALLAGCCVYLWRATKYNLREVNLVE